MRKGTCTRKTRETELSVAIALEGTGRAEVDTGIGFLDHMLEAFALHGGFDLTMKLQGDTRIDLHHSVEDLGIGLGTAMRSALADKRGINRAGFFIFPMDEALATAAVDLCGRPYLRLECPFAQSHLGQLPADLIADFLQAFATALEAAVHIRVENGRSGHHQAEALFKALARALRQACGSDAGLAGKIPSTKGVL